MTGSESLYIDGKVEGAINLPGNRVTVGRNGQVAANIVAREIVVLGKVRGNCQASDRVDIRSEGSLTGDVIAARISIEDGAFFKGGIDIRKPGGTDLKGGPASAGSRTCRRRSIAQIEKSSQNENGLGSIPGLFLRLLEVLRFSEKVKRKIANHSKDRDYGELPRRC